MLGIGRELGQRTAAVACDHEQSDHRRKHQREIRVPQNGGDADGPSPVLRHALCRSGKRNGHGVGRDQHDRQHDRQERQAQRWQSRLLDWFGRIGHFAGVRAHLQRLPAVQSATDQQADRRHRQGDEPADENHRAEVDPEGGRHEQRPWRRGNHRVGHRAPGNNRSDVEDVVLPLLGPE